MSEYLGGEVWAILPTQDYMLLPVKNYALYAFYNKSFVNQGCLVKMEYWHHSMDCQQPQPVTLIMAEHD